MLKDVPWKTVYRSDEDDLLQDFYLPALNQAERYDRAVGYFSTELLALAAKGLGHLIKSDGKMRLIIGHPLDDDEYQAVLDGHSKNWMKDVLEDKLIELLGTQADDIKNYRLNLLSWMIACNRLEIKFACRRKGMYHEKIGVITDTDGDRLVFQGSANETEFAMDPSFNAESFSVYQSWDDFFPRYGQYYEAAFENLWNGRQSNTVTIALPSSSYSRIASALKTQNKPDLELEVDIIDQEMRRNSLSNAESAPHVPKVLGGNEFEIRAHQKKALERWQTNGLNGILKLATGSGKTITAIYGAVVMYQKLGRLSFVIAVPYVDLAKQWIKNLEDFGINAIPCFDSKDLWFPRLKRSKDAFNTGASSFLAAVVVNRTLCSEHFQSLLGEVDKSTMLFVGDECHRHAGEKVRSFLPDSVYKLGLSATPFVDDDDEVETQFPNVAKERLVGYYGEVVDEYTLSDAINDDVLTPYKYYMHVVRLSEDEQEDYEELTKKIANVLSCVEDPANNDSLTTLFGKRSRLLGECENKFLKLKALLSDFNGEKNHTLFYCPEGGGGEDGNERNIDRVSMILNENGWKTSHFTSGEGKREREEILQSFLVGGVDALVSMKVLDEGIDIPACQTAFILASTRNERQYVQRRGRILRKHEGKEYAVIHDFVVMPAEGWEASNASKSLIKAEKVRLNDFINLAINKKECYETLEWIEGI